MRQTLARCSSVLKSDTVSECHYKTRKALTSKSRQHHVYFALQSAVQRHCDDLAGSDPTDDQEDK